MAMNDFILWLGISILIVTILRMVYLNTKQRNAIYRLAKDFADIYNKAMDDGIPLEIIEEYIKITHEHNIDSQEALEFRRLHSSLFGFSQMIQSMHNVIKKLN